MLSPSPVNTERNSPQYRRLVAQMCRVRDGVSCGLHVGAEAAAENDSLGSKLANANMKVAALEADVASASESHNETSAELASLRQRLSATQAESAEAAAEAEAEQNRLAAELDDAELKVQSLERARQDLVSACNFCAALLLVELCIVQASLFCRRD